MIAVKGKSSTSFLYEINIGALEPVLQNRDERHIDGGHGVIAWGLLPRPGEMSAAISALRFMKAAPSPPRPNGRRLAPLSPTRAYAKPEPVATRNGLGLRRGAVRRRHGDALIRLNEGCLRRASPIAGDCHAGRRSPRAFW
jgi:hypothetical protein